ncbi:hypothetical protein SAMN05421856_11171 [Chryseobacterium taichungense]|uniref:Uncharacterized protein n=1 Tax=Chryseobacterium taichungense TaxID=295069 RepID=A0A1H8D3W5_9FLAO|nr:hypothetical protein [Chryseobacterium taichungense]SEN01217.1 hypothetical protein SAMN05421856_11171 [Chryseobacterium taichungense]
MILLQKTQKKVQDKRMKKIKNSFLSYFIIINLYSCQKVDLEKSFQKNDIKNPNSMERILQKQIRNGANQYIEEAGVAIPLFFEQEDIEVEINVVNNILKESGYKIPSDNEFKEKIKDIFNREIIYTSKNKYLYINYLDKCNHEYLNYKNNGVDYFGTYIIKENNFISDFFFIPELINYQQIFPQLVSLEESTPTEKRDNKGNSILIEKWSDLEKNTDKSYNLILRRQHNVQTIIFRNKYLFNDEKASLVWLKFNDKTFLESLVKIFGYVKNKELLQWVLENNYKNIKEFEKILWNKKCDGKIIFNKEVIDLIQQFPKGKQEEYLNQISAYILEEMQRTDSALKNDFSQEAEILGKLSYYGEKIGEKIGMPYQCFKFLTIHEGGKEFEEEFKKQNYYNIPDFKQVWDETKTGGIWLPGMDEASNDNNKSKELNILHLFDRPDFSSFSRKVTVKGKIEICYNTSGWDFIKVAGTTGYLPTEEAGKEKQETEQPKHSFLADDEPTSKKKKSFWDSLLS